MKRFENQKYLIIAMAVVLVFFVVQAIVYITGNNSVDEPKQISIIAYGADADRWENLKDGAELACEKSEAEISVVTMSDADDFDEQCILIDREIANGADGVIIAACNSEKVGSFLKEKSYKTPVVFAETGDGGISGYDTVSADDYQLGADLAEQVIENERSWIKVAIVADDMDRNSIATRWQGVYDTLKGYAPNIVTWDRNENEKDMMTRKYLQRWLVEEAVDVVVTLDSESTDALMDAMDNLNKTRKVYSIATSNKAVYYLDHDKIKALKYQDEFGIGYLSAARVLRLLGEDAPDDDKAIASRIVVKSDIYEGDNEKILFPFVK